MENLQTDSGAGAPPADNRPLRRMRLFNFFTLLKRRNLDLGEIDAGKPALQAAAPPPPPTPKPEPATISLGPKTLPSPSPRNLPKSLLSPSACNFCLLKCRTLDLGEIEAGKPAAQAAAPAAAADPKPEPATISLGPKTLPSPSPKSLLSPSASRLLPLYQICDSRAIACYHPD
jgi:hypothetical protein